MQLHCKRFLVIFMRKFVRYQDICTDTSARFVYTHARAGCDRPCICENCSPHWKLSYLFGVLLKFPINRHTYEILVM